jgi:flagellar basal-body rod protein FlgB
MLQAMFERESVPVLEAALSFANQRHRVILQNIANVETPYYKRQDVPSGEFNQALSEAIAERAEAHPNTFELRDTWNIEFPETGLTPVRARADDAQEFGPERHDENSVVIEKEMADLAKNTLRMEVMQRLLKKKYTMLRSALRDQVA